MTQQAAAAAGVDRAFVDEFVERWTDAWNSHEPDRLLALMTEDIVYEDSAWPTPMRGHADVRQFLDFSWRAFPDMRFEGADGPFLHPDEPKAAFYWRGFATHSGSIDPPGLAATGRKIEFDGADFHEYRDGKVARLRIVFDMTDVMRQLGAMPPPGSRGERVAMMLTNAQTRLRRRT